MKGDLFGCPETSSLAHCISEDIRMGKGIAVIFKNKFGGIQDLKNQGLLLVFLLEILYTIGTKVCYRFI